MSHAHGAAHGDNDNKKIAIMISIPALLLAIAETAAKSAQTNALSYNVEASNLWSFFQAKTIRKTTLETAAEHMDVDAQLARDAQVKQLLETRVAGWKQRVATYESETEAQWAGRGTAGTDGAPSWPRRSVTWQWPSITTTIAMSSRRLTSSPA